MLATIPVGVSAAMVPTTAASSTSPVAAQAQTGRSPADRGGEFDVVDGRRATAVKSVDSTGADAGPSGTAVGVGVKTAAPVDPSCGAGLGAAAALAPPSVCAVTEPAGMNWSVFDPGNIIPDGIFYDTAALSDVQIRDFIDSQGGGCTGPYCLKNLRITTQDQPADQYCSAYVGAVNEDAAAVVGKVSRACGVNPQVMLVTLQKESGLLGRTDPTASTYDAAWGWHCPDTGPGGSANCDPAYAGFFNQAYGMAKQWSRYRVDPFNYNYRAGQTVDILWNVLESGCGSAPVTIANTATASLYNYTPYQPNAAALASYPGTGDACSAYGNRNFFFLFGKYFGDATSGQPGLGGMSRPGSGGSLFTARVALINSPAMTEVTIPSNGFVDPALAGRVITAPTASVAAGLAAGFSALGLPYVWGGGGSGAGPNNGCSRGGGALNSCGSEIGFDCSGLTAFVLGRAGFIIPGDSSSQRAVGTRITWDRALPGDVVGFPGHVAIYLGSINGARYILEASTVGTPVHIVKLTRTDADPQVYRFWAGIPQIGVNGSTFIPASPWSGAGGAGAGRTYYSTIPRYFPVAPPAVAPISVAALAPTLPASTAGATPTVPPAPATVPSPAAAPSTSSTSTAAAPTTAPPTSAPVATASPVVPTATAPITTTPTAASPTAASPTTAAQSTTAPPTTAQSTTAAATTDTASPTAGPGTTPAASTPTSTEPAAPTAIGESTTLESTVPETTVPETAVPETAVPETTVPGAVAPAETPTIPAAPGPTASAAPSPDATPSPAAACLAEPATTASIPTASPTPSVPPKASRYSAPPVQPTLFMTIVALATSAMTGDPAGLAQPVSATC